MVNLLCLFDSLPPPSFSLKLVYIAVIQGYYFCSVLSKRKRMHSFVNKHTYTFNPLGIPGNICLSTLSYIFMYCSLYINLQVSLYRRKAPLTHRQFCKHARGHQIIPTRSTRLLFLLLSFLKPTRLCLLKDLKSVFPTQV